MTGQTNINPMQTSEEREIELKIMLLFLLDKMKTPLSFALITQFVVEHNYLNTYNAQIFVEELVEAGCIEKTEDPHGTRHSVTSEGKKMLDVYPNKVPPALKAKIAKFVSENRGNAKREFEITANYHYNRNSNEFFVNCMALEDELPLMEISLSVVTKEQALAVCNNWRNNSDHLYSEILRILMERKKKAE